MQSTNTGLDINVINIAQRYSAEIGHERVQQMERYINVALPIRQVMSEGRGSGA